MRRLSIRWKFAQWAAVLVGLALLAYSAGTLRNLHHEQIEAVDLTIESRGRLFSGMPEAEILSRPLDVLLQYQPWSALAVFNDKGQLERLSPKLPEQLARAATTEPRLHTARTPGKAAWRLQAYRAGKLTVVVGHDLEEVEEIVRDLMVAYVLSLPIALAVAALGGWWVAGHALRPIRALMVSAENIRPDLPEWRVPIEPKEPRDELRRLAEALNATLTRLATSYQQSQRFAADASHELRTPLTIMRGELDRLIRHPGLEPAVEEKLLSLQEEVVRLDRITEHLLLLARFDAGNAVMQRQTVDLSKLVADGCEDIELLAAVHKITLRTLVPPALAVMGDAIHLRRALLALLDNAVRYNHESGEISCQLLEASGKAEIHIVNTGVGIPAESRGQLFQRFYRADPARGRGGHGLGLSLAREIVRAHGGDIILAEQSLPNRTEFVLSLPLST
jgi:signal transduction histidine kinase